MGAGLHEPPVLIHAPQGEDGSVSVVDRLDGERRPARHRPAAAGRGPVPADADDPLEEVGDRPGDSAVGLAQDRVRAADEIHPPGRGPDDESLGRQPAGVDAGLPALGAVPDDNGRLVRSGRGIHHLQRGAGRLLDAGDEFADELTEERRRRGDVFAAAARGHVDHRPRLSVVNHDDRLVSRLFQPRHVCQVRRLVRPVRRNGAAVAARGREHHDNDPSVDHRAHLPECPAARPVASGEPVWTASRPFTSREGNGIVRLRQSVDGFRASP